LAIVAGHRDVVGVLRLQVGDDFVQHRAVMHEAAPAQPVQVAGDALAAQVEH